MGQSNFCSSCTAMYAGHYCKINSISADQYSKQAELIAVLQRQNIGDWRIMLENGPSYTSAQCGGFFSHHTVSNLALSRLSCVQCAMIWQSMAKPLTGPFSIDELESEDIGIPLILPRFTPDQGPFTLGFCYVNRGSDGSIKWRQMQKLVNCCVLDMDLQENKATWIPEWNRDESISRIRSWIQDRQNPISQPLDLPARLVHIPKQAMSGESYHVRLVDTANLNKNTRYAALSHRWGNINPLRHLKENSRALFEGILLSEVPPTFQDAIRLAYSLGIHYLWVDSLCIIQDSKDDWEVEASKMAIVYLGAQVTISAIAAQNSSTGTLTNSILRYPCCIAPTWTGFEDVDVGLPRRFRIIDRYTYSRNITQNPLLRRGWVYQETILSQKTIYCAEDQLWWTSAADAEGYAYNETCRGYSYHSVVAFGISKLVSRDKLFSSWSNNGTNHLGLVPNEIWRQIIADYTFRQLTYESDRLVAVAGIASVYQILASIPSGSYMAGLWRQTILQDLLWDVEGGRRSYPPQQYRSPSWSWASMEPLAADPEIFEIGFMIRSAGSVNWQDSDSARIEDVHVETRAGLEYGPVLNAYLVLHGPMFAAEISITSKAVPKRFQIQVSAFNQPTDECFPYIRSTLSLPRVSQHQNNLESVNDLSETIITMDEALPCIDNINHMTVYVAVVALRPMNDEKSGNLGYALVLTKTNHTKGEYRRIGVVTLDYDTEIMHPFEKQRDFSTYKHLNEDDYLHKARKPGYYTYRIV